MQIVKVRLNNFKSYTENSIKFCEGVISIAGENEAGKSSILDAIGFALFDFNKFQNVKQMIRAGAKNGKIEVTFRLNDERDYKVIRGVGHSKYEIYDLETNITIATDATNSKQWLAEQFGFKDTTELKVFFENVIGVPQGRIASDFLQTGSTRASIFNPILRTEEYKKAFNNSSHIPTFIDKKITNISKLLAGFEAKIQLLELVPEETKKKREDFQKTLRTIEKVKKAKIRIGEELEVMEREEKKIQQFQHQINLLTKEYEGLQAQLNGKKGDLQKAKNAAVMIEKTQSGYNKTLKLDQKLKILDGAQLKRRELELLLNKSKIAHEKCETEIKGEEKKIKKIEGAEKENKALSKKKEKYDATKSEIERLQGYKVKKAKIQSTLENLQREYDGNVKEQEKLSRDVSQFGDLEKKRDESSQLQKDLDAIIQEKTSLKTKITLLEKNKEKAQDKICPIFEEECPIVPSSFQSYFEPEIKSKKASLEKLKGDHRAIKKKLVPLKNIEGELGSLRTKQESLQKMSHKTIPTLVQQIEKQKEKGKEYSSIESQMNTLQNEQKTLEGDVSRFNANQLHINEKSSVQKTINILITTLEQTEHKKKELIEELKEFQDLDEKIEKVKSRKNDLESDYKNYLAHESQAKEVPSLIKKCERFSAQINTTQDQIKLHKENLATIEEKFDEKQLEALRGEKSEIVQKIAALSEQKEQQEEQLEKLEAQLAQLNDLKDKVKTNKVEEKGLASDLELLKFIRTIYQDAGPKIIDIYTRRVSRMADGIFKNLTDDYSRELKWTSDFAVQTKRKGEVEDFIQFSGGKQMAAALAIRMALLRLSNIDIAFFDEPTQNLDIGRRVRLAEALQNIKGFTQLFIISHDDTFDRTIENVIKIVKDSNNISQVNYF